MPKQPLINLVGAFSLSPPDIERGDLTIELPFKRSIIGSLVLAGFLLVFAMPLFDNSMGGGPEDSLFALVTFLFMLFWKIGWSVGVAFLAILFLGSIFGQERVILKEGEMLVRMEIFGMGFTQHFPGSEITELERFEPPPSSREGWRGPHMIFKYEGNPVHFGSQVDARTAELLVNDTIERVLIPAASMDRVTASPEAEKPVKALSPAAPTNQSASTLALIFANALPLLGVIFLDWQVGEIMLIYWAESAVIGIYNLAKMWVIGRWAVLFMGPFFLGHYGGFMVGHLFFIYGFMIGGMEGDVPLSEVLKDFIYLLPVLLALFISHGISFMQNFIGRREYEGLQIAQQMTEPYKRILIMHVTIIFGGFLVMFLDNALPALLFMVVLKIVVDMRAHRKEHGDLAEDA